MSAPSSRSTVLIVDDEPLNREMLQQVLAQEPYAVLVAADGQQALELAALHSPDVIVLDVMMPGLDGFDVCKKLRADPRLQQVPILLLTALEGRPCRLRGLAAGADDFLRKPFDPVELRMRLRTITRLNRFRQLVDERSRFETAINHSPDGIALTDGDGGVLHANPAFHRLAGSRPDNIFSLLPADLARQLRVRLTEQSQPGRLLGPIESEFTGAAATSVELTVISLPDSHGTMLEVIARDLTERKQLETQLLRSQRIELLGQLAGGIVHDVNNLLTVIGCHSELAGPASPAEAAEHLATIQQCTQRGAALLQQILRFARGSDEKLTPVSVAQILTETAAIVREVLDRQITVQLDAPANLPRVLADRDQLHQVVMNLCVNARDAMPNGGQLTLSAVRRVVSADEAARLGSDAQAGEFVVLAVRDSGTGIPPHLIAKLFDPFFTTKAPGQGTGLGLATVLRLIRRHRGFVHLETALGTGTCFHCFLPVPSAVAAAA